MYLSRITPVPKTSKLARLAALASAGPYGIHQALWRLFGAEDQIKRDFLFRQLGQHDELAFYLLSARQPGADDGLWQIESKLFAPKLRQGQILRFSIRINPVVKRRDPNRRQQRHDLVMDMKHQDRNGNQDRTQQERVQKAGLVWLKQRQEQSGYTLHDDSLLAEAYRQHRFRGKGGRSISLSTMDCDGSLVVTDPERFRAVLSRGLGPAKAFGCGLLLIRPG